MFTISFETTTIESENAKYISEQTWKKQGFCRLIPMSYREFQILNGLI